MAAAGAAPGPPATPGSWRHAGEADVGCDERTRFVLELEFVQASAFMDEAA